MAPPTTLRTLLARWQPVDVAVLPLRLFLGGTFTYAGLDKLIDPSWTRSGALGSFQYQAQLAAPSSPLRSLVRFSAGHSPALFALGLALSELAVGLLTLLRVLPRFAALVGFGLSLTLFLTVSFAVRPYYLGNDLAYAAAWTPLLFVPAEPVWARLPVLRAPPRNAGRRRFVYGLAAGGVFAVVAGVAAVLNPGPAPKERAQRASSRSRSGPIALPALEPGESLQFLDRSGVKSIAVGRPGGGVVAFEATCRHNRCIVKYESRFDAFVCPCHGSTYAGADGRNLGGPAPAPLLPADL